MPPASRLALRLRRIIEVLLAAILLALAAPLMLLIWAAVRFDDGAPSLFRQTRAGLQGKPVTIHKFRTLRRSAPADTVVAEGDTRITRTGTFLRRSRLDELPQLFDVLRGDLALVGPRPELEVDLQGLAPAVLDAFLAIKPGMTGPVQLQYIGEDAWLAGTSDPTRSYRDLLLPAKVAANLEAFARRSLRADLGCLLHTAAVLLSPAARQRSRKALEATLPRCP